MSMCTIFTSNGQSLGRTWILDDGALEFVQGHGLAFDDGKPVAKLGTTSKGGSIQSWKGITRSLSLLEYAASRAR